MSHTLILVRKQGLYNALVKAVVFQKRIVLIASKEGNFLHFLEVRQLAVLHEEFFKLDLFLALHFLDLLHQKELPECLFSSDEIPHLVF